MEKSKGALSITSLAPLRTTGTFNLNDVQGVYPNATSRKFLAEEWRRLSPDDQLILRAARSKRGWRCDICGSNGYFREICPNQCTSPPSTPDSLASSAPPTPPHDTCSQSITIKSKESTGTGVFWGQKKFKGFRGRKKKDPNEPVTTSHLNEKVDLTTLRPDAMHKLEELRTSDENLKHSYYLNSDEMYSRNYAELTLQQVMRRMIRLLEKELKATIAELTASFDTSLLHPPKRVIQSTFYPKELMKFPEFREYFLKKESEVKNNNYYYKHQSSVRPVDDLDSLFRGPANSSNELFIRKSNAGESVHSKNTWKSVLSKNDLLASSDPLLAKKQADLDNMFANQSKWISLQQTSMQYQNERFEHLLFLVHNEIEKEHAREADLLSAKTKRSEKDVAMRLWQERSHSVDLLLAILQSYQFTAGLEEADFLLFCFERWQKQNKSFGSSSSSSKKSILYNKSQNTDSITSNNIMDGEDENDNIDQPNERPTKNSAKFKSTKQPNAMISAMTNPYYHDVQFVQKVKKKREKLFEMGKTGRAMTAAEQREALKEKQLEQMKMLQALENGGSLKDQGAPALVQEDENNGEVSVPSSPTRRKTVQISEQFNYSHDSYDDPTVGGGQQHSFSLQRSFTNISNKSGTSTCTHNSSPSKSILPPSLPDLSDIINQAKQHQTEINEQKQRTWEQRNVVNTLASGAHETSTTGKEVLHRKPYIHPKDLDTMHIAKVKKAFKMAGLGNRIRKGNDDDFAMALPALIPIPKAFDGNSSMVSHTANQIVFQLKRDMVLSDIGYTPQTVVPLYVRNTLYEKEGTSKMGDPTQEELALDRRYSHYVGRPMIRFNPSESSALPSDNAIDDESMDGESTATSTTNASTVKKTLSRSKPKLASTDEAKGHGMLRGDDLSVLTKQFFRHTTSTLTNATATATATTGGVANTTVFDSKNPKTWDKQTRREVKKLQAAAKTTPMSHSLVRLVFEKPAPSLADLKYLDEEF